MANTSTPMLLKKHQKHQKHHHHHHHHHRHHKKTESFHQFEHKYAYHIIFPWVPQQKKHDIRMVYPSQSFSTGWGELGS